MTLEPVSLLIGVLVGVLLVQAPASLTNNSIVESPNAEFQQSQPTTVNVETPPAEN